MAEKPGNRTSESFPSCKSGTPEVAAAMIIIGAMLAAVPARADYTMIAGGIPIRIRLKNFFK
ncbi:hypothetical protein [Desulfonema magnum]|uniref:Uncharacterized protein n=1 Tax=Desulfonema magnum TaxID=45655 RepID=A0A975BE70_9BACT|nr:hypothetical protein [Desulfonema magnum]QTA84049.1 Uncharacterized protein dnm_000410 [Desulfonema magnum]